MSGGPGRGCETGRRRARRDTLGDAFARSVQRQPEALALTFSGREWSYRAVDRAGLTLHDLDWIEVNEAFASVVLAWARELGADLGKVNPWGGAIAHGHPLGASGAGLSAKLLAGLEATGGTLGLQTMCIGHGMATATIIERV